MTRKGKLRDFKDLTWKRTSNPPESCRASSKPRGVLCHPGCSAFGCVVPFLHPVISFHRRMSDACLVLGTLLHSEFYILKKKWSHRICRRGRNTKNISSRGAKRVHVLHEGGHGFSSWLQKPNKRVQNHNCNATNSTKARHVLSCKHISLGIGSSDILRYLFYIVMSA